MTASDCGRDRPMRTVDLSRSGSVDSPCVLALGNFDGVHLAHRALIGRAVEISRQAGVEPAVFTFREGKGGESLADFDEKIRLLSGLGLSYAACADFASIRGLTPESFFREILIGRLHAVGLVCGFNFRFGRDAAGDTDTLAALCHAHSVRLEVLPPVIWDGAPISSTRIRDALKGGRPDLAAAMLGRPFALAGEIAPGRQVGRKSGCPTLNLPLKKGIVAPKFGVYFTRCRLDGLEFPSVSNIGVRPTFDERYGASVPLCEVHLLGDADALSRADPAPGRPVWVELDAFRRPERKFDSPDALYRQIAEDVAGATAFYREGKPG